MNNKDAFLHKIADGKLLMRKLADSGTMFCDCCHAERRAPRGAPDDLPHKEWCVVTYARKFFPSFIPSDYPETVEKTRTYFNEDQFPWFDGEEE